MCNFEFVERYKDFLIFKDDLCFVLKRGSDVCGLYETRSQALNAADNWIKYFGGYYD